MSEERASKKFKFFRISGMILLVISFIIGAIISGILVMNKNQTDKTSEDLSLTFGQPELSVPEAQALYMAAGHTFLNDLCGYPELGEMARQRLRNIINTCPNTEERKRAFHNVLKRGEAMGQRSIAKPNASAKGRNCKNIPLSYEDYRKAVKLYQVPIAEECRMVNAIPGENLF